MNLNAYTQLTRATAIYPKEQALTYLALGLGSEAGEVQGKVKKMIRDGGINVMDTLDEIGDCYWYLSRLCDELNWNPEDVLQRNIAKLESRKERGVLGGSGDKR
jgi:NTP pyrophosphatase (non-canonical NTP hydrolase)